MTNPRNNYCTKVFRRKLLFAGLLRKAREPGSDPLQANLGGTGSRISFPGMWDVDEFEDEYCVRCKRTMRFKLGVRSLEAKS
jgi:hypothetical protein